MSFFPPFAFWVAETCGLLLAMMALPTLLEVSCRLLATILTPRSK